MGDEHIRDLQARVNYDDNLPDNRSLDDVLPVFLDSVEDTRGFRFDYSFDGKVEINANLGALCRYHRR